MPLLAKFQTIIIVLFFSIFYIYTTNTPINIKGDEYIEYTKDIEVLNFESLLSFPDKGFNENNPHKNIYDHTKITPYEFKKILTDLHANNYILITPKEIFENTSSQLIFKKLLLPKNKKPIMLLFNNINYKNSHSNPAEIDKIIIDRNNQPATYSTHKSIRNRIAYDNEFVTILENFIQSNPDFSLNNSRGIIFLSGKNGILGYSTNPRNSSSSHDKKRVLEVIENLKTRGWEFGCNNYTYTTTSNSLSEIEFTKDLSLWQKEIRPLIGTTPYYLSKEVSINDTIKIQSLIDNDFRVLFFDDKKAELLKKDSYINFTYKDVNGNTLRNDPDIFKDMFNSRNVYDHSTRFVPFDSIST